MGWGRWQTFFGSFFSKKNCFLERKECHRRSNLTGLAGARMLAAIKPNLDRKPMLRSLMLAACTVFALSSAAIAAEVTETVDTSAPPKAVWKVIGKFDAIADWLPGTASSPATKHSTVGSVRTITLKAPGNPTVVETLTARGKRSYSYRIDQVDPKVLPVTGYTSTISVVKTKGGSTVTWHGDFTPAGGASEAASEKAVSGLYRSGLDNIKALVEK